MEAPKSGLSLAGLNAAISEHFRQKYQNNTNDGYHCKGCDKKVLFVRCDVSIHDTKPGGACEGFGEVKNFPLPYCPQCEGEPVLKNTCIHVGTE